MSWSDFWFLLLFTAATMLACRTLPFFILKGRQLPESAARALNLIPPAAFAALVANDLLTPGMFASGFWPAGAVLIAALCVVVVAIKFKSLVWCAITGVVVYAILMMI
jgi:branched-subunit amino acid transport protein